MKVKVIGANELFPWQCNQEINAEITHLENDMHQVMVDGVKYVLEISKFFVVNNSKIILSGFLTDNTNVGKIGFELNYE